MSEPQENLGKFSERVNASRPADPLAPLAGALEVFFRKHGKFLEETLPQAVDGTEAGKKHSPVMQKVAALFYMITSSEELPKPRDYAQYNVDTSRLHGMLNTGNGGIIRVLGSRLSDLVFGLGWELHRNSDKSCEQRLGTMRDDFREVEKVFLEMLEQQPERRVG